VTFQLQEVPTPEKRFQPELPRFCLGKMRKNSEILFPVNSDFSSEANATMFATKFYNALDPNTIEEEPLYDTCESR
jgi:hypothetical protein